MKATCLDKRGRRRQSLARMRHGEGGGWSRNGEVS